MRVYKMQIATQSGGRLTRFLQAKTFIGAAKEADKVVKEEKQSGFWTPSERSALTLASLEHVGDLENA